MTRRTVFIGLAVFSLFWLIGFIRWLPYLASNVFSDDALEYSKIAIHLLRDGFYSLDGIEPFFGREPGMSLFLVGLYAIGGIENSFALFITQGILFFLASWFFCVQVCQTFGKRIGTLCFFLLLTHVSIFHSIFSGYRECLALVVLLCFAGLLLYGARTPRLTTSIVAGILLGFAILIYFSFFFFPILLFAVLLFQRASWKMILPLTIVPFLVVSPWLIRNATYGEKAAELAKLRMTFVWHVRGEQAEKVQGLEPFRCLWSEYISRDWSQRSDACSFNGVKNKQWPDGNLRGDEATIAAIGQQKIAQHPFSYLWFSLVDIIELHLPYVGGGWSTLYHAAAAAASVVLFAGILFGVGILVDKNFWPFLSLAAYNTLIFIFTDATPRYLIPVIFCYVLMSAYGYHRLLLRRKA